jgi:hypothetical protein
VVQGEQRQDHVKIEVCFIHSFISH